MPAYRNDDQVEAEAAAAVRAAFVRLKAAPAPTADEIAPIYGDADAKAADELPPTPRWMHARWTAERRRTFDRASRAEREASRARWDETQAAIEAHHRPGRRAEARLRALTLRRRLTEERARCLVRAYRERAGKLPTAPPNTAFRPRAPHRHRQQRVHTGARSSRDGPPEPPPDRPTPFLRVLAALRRVARS